MHALTPLAYDPHTGAPLDAALHLHDGFICRVTLLPHHDIAAFRAKRQAPVLDLSARGTLDPTHYWEPLFPSHRHSLVLEPEAFYLLLSLERLSIPHAAAADIAPYELSLGELRTHYAGFFDPGFGTASDGLPGTPAVLEVRPHDVPYLIEHEQPLFKLRYASLQTPPQRLYGATIGSTYHRQTLTLSKPFQPWPQGS
jgi:dCTP deaminase